MSYEVAIELGGIVRVEQSLTTNEGILNVGSDAVSIASRQCVDCCGRAMSSLFSNLFFQSCAKCSLSSSLRL